MSVKLDDSVSPKTVAAIIDSLPIKVMINWWGDELYIDAIPAKVREENARAVVKRIDVAYWPEGSEVCIFYGPTPVSTQGQIIPYPPVNMFGRITNTIPLSDLQKFLQSIEESHIHKKIPIVLC